MLVPLYQRIKLLDAIKKSGDKSFPFATEMTSKFAVVRVPLC